MTQKIWREMGLSDADYEKICNILGRQPNQVELGMFGVMWSEHCSYKHSKPVLKTFPTCGSQVLQGPGENAGIVDIGDGQAIVFKMESHNHPSAIEPYQGAATGVGGIVRDIFAMGARPIALLNSLRFGPLHDAHVRWLMSGVVAGIAGYGNCLGIPTVAGEVFFNESYTGNPLVNAMCIGIVNHEDIHRGTASGIGNAVVLIGAKTGRDGIAGASFASEELSDDAEDKRPAVQVGDPFMEKLLIEACLELITTEAIVGMQDLGAAGLTSSASEMASRSDTGIEIDVSRVPLRETGMTPYEIMLSESQERMLAIVKPEKLAEVHRIVAKWGLDSTVIGTVTDDGLLRIKNGDKVIAQVPASALAADAPVVEASTLRPPYLDKVQQLKLEQIPEPQDYRSVFYRVLGSPNVASKEWVYRQYDHMVRTNTVILPGADAAVLRVKGTAKGIAVSCDCNPRYVYLDPYEGGKIAVAEAARNVACSGARPLAITNCLNFGNPEKPEIFWTFVQAVRGMSAACEALNTPVTGGNVSFYNETNGKPIYPTPTVGMVGLIDNVENAITSAVKAEGDVLVLLGGIGSELGGSEYLAVVHNTVAGRPPRLNLEREARLQQFLVAAAGGKLLNSAHDIAEGGLICCLAEKAIQGQYGIRVEIKQHCLRDDVILFNESQSRVVVSCSPKQLDDVLSLAAEHNVEAQVIGHVGGERFIIRTANQLVDEALSEITRCWREAIACYMKS